MDIEKHPLQSLLEISNANIRSYSGRGMLGKQCLGVTIRKGGLGTFIGDVLREAAALDSDTREEIAKGFKGMATDAMGQDEIVYFQSVPYTFEA
jgi:hypothetical protein